jgi:hypothetical protein
MSIYEQQSIMQTLMPSNQRDIVEPYIQKFFEIIPRIFKTRTKDDRETFFHSMSPSKFADEELLVKYKKLLSVIGGIVSYISIQSSI